MEEDWQRDLGHWLEPYLQKLGNKTRRRMCPAYIAGLIGPGDRKSIQPMAARADALSYDRLHHSLVPEFGTARRWRPSCGGKRTSWSVALADH